MEKLTRIQNLSKAEKDMLNLINTSDKVYLGGTYGAGKTMYSCLVWGDDFEAEIE